MLYHYYIHNVEDGTQIGVYKINKEKANRFSQFISVKVKHILRKSQAQILGKQ